MNKDRINKLTYLILNNVISKFGLRIRNDKLVFLYRLPLDGCKNIHEINRILDKGNFHVVPVTSDLKEIFNFVHLDYDEYEQGFKDMFTYSNWILRNCSYLTRLDINSLKHGLENYDFEEDVEFKNDIRKFLSYVKLSHEEIRDNELTPALSYYNIREDIVRNFFYNEKLEEKLLEYKKNDLFKNELLDKFTGDKIVFWIPELNENKKLLDKFLHSFISYVTDGKKENFSNHLIDNETAEIRREAVLFYNYIFINDPECKIYLLEGVDNKYVIM